jgi:cystathionine gamma-synthase
MHFETKAIHAGAHIDTETGAVAPPIHLSTTFERDESGEASHGYSYIRDANPTQTRLEEAMAAIEGGESALAFASGIGAAAAILQSVEPGAHVLLPDDSYYAMRKIARDHFPQWQLTYDLVSMDDLHTVQRAMRDTTRLVWAESPSNPLMKVCDLRALAGLAHARGAQLAVDNTFATPALQRPLELGADLVMHSTTKYLGGHSDVAGGVIVCRTGNPACPKLLEIRHLLGAIASPFNSWLVLRGIRTLAARMRVHCDNAMAVARFIESHPRVEAVHYPGLASHPGHEVARGQMSQFGGMLSFRVRGSRADTLAVAARTKIFVRATSLGGVESLIEHRASSEGPTTTTPENLLRMSVGLEHAEDLIDDLAQALS